MQHDENLFTAIKRAAVQRKSKFHARCPDDSERAGATIKQPYANLSIVLVRMSERALCEFNVPRLCNYAMIRRNSEAGERKVFTCTPRVSAQQISKLNRMSLSNMECALAR